MNRTQIEWAKNPDGTPGYTWNPITGCLNHVNGLCKGGNFPCYAYRLATTRLRERYLLNPKVADVDRQLSDSQSPLWNKVIRDPFYPRFWPERLNSGMIDRGNKGIFVCDMSDLFGIGIPDEWTRRVLQRIREKTNHRFYLLTKQPQNLPQWSPFPDNCWVGVTATNTMMFYKAEYYLRHIEAKIKYVSYEPMLQWDKHTQQSILHSQRPAWLNWLIIGAQTRPTVYPKIEWVEEIVGAADRAGVKVFLKDNLKPLLDSADCPQWAFEKLLSWEIHRRLRQEMPGEER